MNENTKWEPCDPGCLGWGLFNDDEIQRCDACDRFANDNEATVFVAREYIRRLDEVYSANTDVKITAEDAGVLSALLVYFAEETR